MKRRTVSSSLILGALVVLLCWTIQTGICREEKEEATMATMKLGGVQDLRISGNSGEIDELGRFAVQEHNKRENKLLEFKNVVKAKQQVVAGTMYHLTLEANDNGQKKMFEAKVWVKPWMNFKQLQEFNPTRD